MVLVDTSVWIAHLRDAISELGNLLNTGEVACHPWVIGELTLGGINVEVAELLSGLPQMTVATDAEVLWFIGEQNLTGTGIGYVDAHLLASSVLVPTTALWTYDSRLSAVAKALAINYG